MVGEDRKLIILPISIQKRNWVYNGKLSMESIHHHFMRAGWMWPVIIHNNAWLNMGNHFCCKPNRMSSGVFVGQLCEWEVDVIRWEQLYPYFYQKHQSWQLQSGWEPQRWNLKGENPSSALPFFYRFAGKISLSEASPENLRVLPRILEINPYSLGVALPNYGCF